MKNEIVLSPVLDKDLSKNLVNSPIWKKAYKPEEFTDELRLSKSKWYEYTIRFDGVKPIMLTKFRALN